MIVLCHAIFGFMIFEFGTVDFVDVIILISTYCQLCYD